MKRKRRLKEVKSIRKIRDTIIAEGNSGRVRTLICSYPFVTYLSVDNGGWKSFATVRVYGGYEYCECATFKIDALRKVSLSVYFAWLNNFKITS